MAIFICNYVNKRGSYWVKCPDSNHGMALILKINCQTQHSSPYRWNTNISIMSWDIYLRLHMVFNVYLYYYVPIQFFYITFISRQNQIHGSNLLQNFILRLPADLLLFWTELLAEPGSDGWQPARESVGIIWCFRTVVVFGLSCVSGGICGHKEAWILRGLCAEAINSNCWRRVEVVGGSYQLLSNVD